MLHIVEILVFHMIYFYNLNRNININYVLKNYNQAFFVITQLKTTIIKIIGIKIH